MKLSRTEAIGFLTELPSMLRHGYAACEIHKMHVVRLAELLNEVFEPIDLDDPYTIEEEKGRSKRLVISRR